MTLIHKVVLRIKGILTWTTYFEALVCFTSTLSPVSRPPLTPGSTLYAFSFPSPPSHFISSPTCFNRSSLCDPGWDKGVPTSTPAFLSFLQFGAFVNIHNSLIAMHKNAFRLHLLLSEEHAYLIANQHELQLYRRARAHRFLGLLRVLVHCV